jgi:hypothetical protein
MIEISKKKPFFPVSKGLSAYLQNYQRNCVLPVSYEDLLRYTDAFPVLDKKGKDTLWNSVIYSQDMTQELDKALTTVYALLKTDGDISVMEHLHVDRIDFCVFGNSHPFRIKIINNYNDNYDYFYVKKADASRIYGLELEHLLSPNRISFLVHKNTLIEEHIAGIPGDAFIQNYLQRPEMNRVRIAKEFVKFNERCFIRLLGDMRAYNYVVDITPDFDNEQYRVRAIDFDQQSYEGKHRMYLPQFFKENNPIVELCLKYVNKETAKQYQHEERTLIGRRLVSARYRVKDLIDVMRKDIISSPEKTYQLKHELAEYHKNNEFLKCKTMGDVVRIQLKVALLK